mmetsp:Transcript_11307/g.26573  ORF Transcript_11307/g.26573 Transcript_11307/m.26573 type:complete len:211 (-) Transcript_11307:145-777(-)
MSFSRRSLSNFGFMKCPNSFMSSLLMWPFFCTSILSYTFKMRPLRFSLISCTSVKLWIMAWNTTESMCWVCSALKTWNSSSLIFPSWLVSVALKCSSHSAFVQSLPPTNSPKAISSSILIFPSPLLSAALNASLRRGVRKVSLCSIALGWTSLDCIFLITGACSSFFVGALMKNLVIKITSTVTIPVTTPTSGKCAMGSLTSSFPEGNFE